jgi:F-type H+-transporting ATPase subunit a
MQKAYSFFDQFEILRLLPFNPVGNLDISITNSTLFLGLATFYIIFMCQTNVENGLVVPGRYQSLIEVLYETIHDMVRENIPGKDGYRFFPFLFTLFIFILVNNLFGLVPYTFSTTSHMGVTVAISVAIFIATLIIGFST